MNRMSVSQQEVTDRNLLNLDIWQRVRELVELSPNGEVAFGDLLEVVSTDYGRGKGDEICAEVWPLGVETAGLRSVFSVTLAETISFDDKAFRVARGFHLHPDGVLGTEITVVAKQLDYEPIFSHGDIGIAGRRALLSELVAIDSIS